MGLEQQVRKAYRLRSRSARRDYRDDMHLRLLLAFTLRKESNCIDVGANRGDVYADMVRLAPAGHHIAYEPLPNLHAELERRFPGNDLRRVALSDASGEASYVHVKTNPSYSGFRERSYDRPERLERITVRTETLDSSLPDGYVPSFIKIDVEGAELQVLAGALQTITAHRPIVFFEHGQGAADHYGTSPRDIYDLLSVEAGLRIFDLDGRGPYDRAGFEAVFHEPIWNFVAH